MFGTGQPRVPGAARNCHSHTWKPENTMIKVRISPVMFDICKMRYAAAAALPHCGVCFQHRMPKEIWEALMG